MAINVTAIPSNYSKGTFDTVSSVTNAYTDSSSTNYGQFITKPKVTGVSELYLYGFNFSTIPDEATINSVTVKVKAQVSSTTYSSSADCQVYTGTTPKGTATSYYSTATTVYTLDAGNSWTKAELDDIRVYFNINRTNNKNNSLYIRIYGVDITVNYSMPTNIDYMNLKLNNQWKAVRKVYKKINNTWVLQTDLPALFADKNITYVRQN